MALLGISGVMDAMRAYALFASLKHLLRTLTSLTQPKVQTKSEGFKTLSGLSKLAYVGKIAFLMPVSAFLHSLGRMLPRFRQHLIC